MFPVSRLRGSQGINGSKYVSTYLNSLTRKDGAYVDYNTYLRSGKRSRHDRTRLHDDDVEPPDMFLFGKI